MALSLNWIDVALSVVVLITIITGLIRGLAMQVIQIGSLALGLALAGKGYPPVAKFIRGQVTLGSNEGVISSYLAMALIFVSTILVLFFLSFLARDIIKKAKLASFDRLLGGFFGAIKGVLICSAIYYALEFLPFPEIRKDLKNNLRVQESSSVALMEWIVETCQFPELFERIEKKQQELRPQPPAQQGATSDS